jgi:VWFA-related protein
MQPEDMVAVISTSYGTSALNFFSSDKRQITARVDNIPFAIPVEMESGRHAKQANEALKARIHGYQVSTVSYSIRALKEMPGRKILFFMSSMPTIELDPSVPAEEQTESIFNVAEERTSVEELLSFNFGSLPENFSEMYVDIFDGLADEALRAGVVVHTLDAKGLVAPDPAVRKNPGGLSRIPNPYYLDGLNGLSHRTGGIFVENSNFFLDGVGREANNMIGGYYLLTYAPPPSTFDVSRKNLYNNVEVKVKRKGAKVYTRDGFYGREEIETEDDDQAHPLQDALYSPFKHADLSVNIAAGYIKDAKAGYLVRSWIHLNPKDVTIIETEDGGAKIDLETVCMTSDISGNVHDYKHVRYTFSIEPEKKPENLAWIRKHGIRFSLLFPVKKPGLYTVRIAVLDTESGKTGSAWQPVEIPDLKKKGLALSDVFMITSADDLGWMLSDTVEEDAEGVFAPAFQAEEVRSPALRTYVPGDSLQTLAVLYNADAKAVAASNIETQFALYKDGAEYQRGEATTVTQESAENRDGIMILRRFTIGSEMPPGDYVLQMIATDKKNSKKQEGVAAQTLGFTIAGND